MEDAHVKRSTESQRLLREAREKARKKHGYDWQATRRDLARIFEEEYKKPPYDWQIDVAEALLLGLDAVVIAGTGAGKTIPFMMPVLLHRDKFVLVVSPLKVLQEDQASRFEAIGLAAAAVNGDTYSRAMQASLDGQKLNTVLTSPEMCLEHPEFRNWLRSEPTGKRILAVIVDEAHCSYQWGGDFRPHYALLDRLRVLLPVGTPVLATSATLNTEALKDICTGLNIDLDESFFLNLGNDRPNITPSIVQMKSSKDYDAIDEHLPDPSAVKTITDVPKSVVFTNAVKKTQVLCRHLRCLYPNLPRSSIDFLHAYRTAKAKRRVMKQFRKGKIKILVATEAAGMGADIPDIELIIQFGVPSSLAVWTQRAGRAGRFPGLQARAIMLVERSMFQRKKPRKGGTKGVEKETVPAPETAAPKVDLNDGLVWGKNVDPILREYISTKLCRRDVADKHFNNPPRRPPTGPCCDNCIRMAGDDSDNNSSSSSRPQTPAQTDSAPQSAHSTPSKHVNANGKRPMAKCSDGPSTRRGEHLQDARSALVSWRTRTFLNKYSFSPFTDTGILPDKILTTLASKRIRTLDEMAEKLPIPWMFAQRHGQEVIDLLKRIDQVRREGIAKAAEVKKAEKRKESEARKAAQQLEKDLAAAANPPRPRPTRKRALRARQPLATAPEHINVNPKQFIPALDADFTFAAHTFHTG
ncbi:P-loop containing nucleoside triphosphate hydrolase protein [Mycena maculata]|uniref:DNA 3'-5' helicase n=1 Tax=Mycena maculata TaxID=230809 RepID=A0AAD7ILW4_9AGAR|nr:P-loop containing nucleoside triphosphate hydrolase protein [Mycena maculata]